MFAPLAHFRLTAVSDVDAQRRENELQELYHRPELLSQPGVAWGERWVHDEACAELSSSNGLSFDYCSTWWLRAPALASAEAFGGHFGRAAHLGLDGGAEHRLDEFMVPLKGYVRREPLVSEQALPFRPNRGVYLVVSRFCRHHDVEAEATFRWYDQVRIPDMLDCPGAAGAWSFAQRNLYSPLRDMSEPTLRMLIYYLDGDPSAFASAVREREAAWRAAGRARDTSAVEDILFAGPLARIVPWRWPSPREERA
jgi:hypothetical protein